MNKRRLITITQLFLALSLCLASSSARASEPLLGVFGMSVVEDYSCIAVWIPLQEEEALAGVRWFNNDGTVLFPHLYASVGSTEGPGSLSDAVVVRGETQGVSSGWSDAWFDEPVASAGGGVYVIFRLPVGCSQVGAGPGGGAGLGYWATEADLPAWTTFNFVEWNRLPPELTIAIEGFIQPATPDVLRLDAGAKGLTQPDESTPQVPLSTVLYSPSPNPFNPKTKIRFSLQTAGHLELILYDLQGRLIKTLVDNEFSAGLHVLEWAGRDNDNRSVASGVYLLRMQAAGFVQSQQMVLVR